MGGGLEGRQRGCSGREEWVGGVEGEVVRVERIMRTNLNKGEK